MRRIMLLMVVAVVLVVLSAAVWAAPAKKPAAAKKPVAAKKVDRAALLAKFKASPPSAVVATVNGEKITKAQLLDSLWDWQAPAALDELIQQKIIQQEATKKGVKVTQAEIDQRVVETRKRMPPDQEFDEALARYGYTKARFLSGTKTGLMIEGVVKKEIKLADADFAQFIKASHILIRIPYGKDEEERKKNEATAKEKIDKIAAEIKGGLDFNEAAKKYSEDETNKDAGGDLPWFKRGKMAPEFENAAFALKPGDISEPVKTSYGFHLIKLDNTGNKASAAEKKDLSDQVIKEQMSTKVPQWLQNLRANAKIENYISPKLPEPPAPKLPAPRPAPKIEMKPAPKAEPKTEAKPVEPKTEVKPAEAPKTE